MQELGFLTPAQAETSRHEALVLVSRERNLTNVAAPYFVETIRRYVADNYGDEELLERGLRVYTTLAGSSPTRTTSSPGTRPCFARNASTPARTSPRTVSANAFPSRTRALMAREPSTF